MPCARPNCPEDGNFACSACQEVDYCSVACQRADWRAHSETDPGCRGGMQTAFNSLDITDCNTDDMIAIMARLYRDLTEAVRARLAGFILGAIFTNVLRGGTEIARYKSVVNAVARKFPNITVHAHYFFSPGWEVEEKGRYAGDVRAFAVLAEMWNVSDTPPENVIYHEDDEFIGIQTFVTEGTVYINGPFDNVLLDHILRAQKIVLGYGYNTSKMLPITQRMLGAFGADKKNSKKIEMQHVAPLFNAIWSDETGFVFKDQSRTEANVVVFNGPASSPGRMNVGKVPRSVFDAAIENGRSIEADIVRYDDRRAFEAAVNGLYEASAIASAEFAAGKFAQALKIVQEAGHHAYFYDIGPLNAETDPATAFSILDGIVAGSPSRMEEMVALADAVFAEVLAVKGSNWKEISYFLLETPQAPKPGNAVVSVRSFLRRNAEVEMSDVAATFLDHAARDGDGAFVAYGKIDDKPGPDDKPNTNFGRFMEKAVTRVNADGTETTTKNIDWGVSEVGTVKLLRVVDVAEFQKRMIIVAAKCCVELSRA